MQEACIPFRNLKEIDMGRVPIQGHLELSSQHAYTRHTPGKSAGGARAAAGTLVIPGAE